VGDKQLTGPYKGEESGAITQQVARLFDPREGRMNSKTARVESDAPSGA